MIGRLEGRLHRVDPGTVLIDVGGVGYLVSTTLRAFQELANRESATLWIHTQVRDDAIVLFGFPGVGPRIALAVLSAVTANELAETVQAGDLARLQRSPGVGLKTAERILLELKDKMAVTSAGRGDLRGDVVSALVNLGYSQRDAQRAIDSVWPEADKNDLGNLLRSALQKLTR